MDIYKCTNNLPCSGRKDSFTPEQRKYLDLLEDRIKVLEDFIARQNSDYASIPCITGVSHINGGVSVTEANKELKPWLDDRWKS